MPAAPPLPTGNFALRVPGRRSWPITADPRLQEMAMRWIAVVFNRERWDTEDGSAELQQRAQLDLDGVGIGPAVRVIIIETGVAEISVPWRGEEHDFEGRVMPWEFVLSLATRAERKGRMITIWRLMDTGKALRVLPKAIKNLPL